jgi:hypothetical protein
LNRIITAIDHEILELDAKAAKLRMLRQAAVSIAEDGGEALIEPAPAPELPPAPDPPPKPARPKRPRRGRAVAEPPSRKAGPDDAELDERVYGAIAAAEGAWVVSGPAMAEELGIEHHSLKRVRLRLQDAGRIERTGHARGSRWRATEFDLPPDSPSNGDKRQESAASERRKAANIGKAKDEDKRLLAIVETAGVDGVDSIEVAAALDCSRASARGRLISFARAGRLVRFDGEGGGSRYRMKAHGLLPVDESGCKTGVERKLLEAVQRAPVALTTVEVAANAKVPIVDAGRVLHGLARRGVVRAIPLKTETSPQRWELPKVMAEAA